MMLLPRVKLTLAVPAKPDEVAVAPAT